MVVHPVRTTERVVSHIHGRLPWRWRMFGRPKGKRNPFAAASIYMKSRIFSCKGTGVAAHPGPLRLSAKIRMAPPFRQEPRLHLFASLRL